MASKLCRGPHFAGRPRDVNYGMKCCLNRYKRTPQTDYGKVKNGSHGKTHIKSQHLLFAFLSYVAGEENLHEIHKVNLLELSF